MMEEEKNLSLSKIDDNFPDNITLAIVIAGACVTKNTWTAPCWICRTSK